ncbi:SpoIIE family protein phosphatase [Evansella cellulosilytica]|uniref:Stage II sporulation protein E n=1 Tax=Evansella cellulosilytica (strain ATCC 21833 / DSM 2522 / FERM P-1141 / JCM 9156 / N-4) TaxID=649639 RepID=E6TVS6_EVAC2|nr:SpoIIE family protein phosphatase [Evansella cellulosilytica]ADU28635.1 Stage II sporulation protein E [Evansella cellulosilytica DSM 2522]
MIQHHKLNGVEISTYTKAKKGNWCSGDSFYTNETEDYIICAIADGLGSGEDARESSSAAINLITEYHRLELDDLMAMCNNVLWNKRGAVVAILKIYKHDRSIVYCNVGNIGCHFYTPSGKLTRPIPSRGYLSGKKQKFRIQRMNFEQGMSFVLYSDGLLFTPFFHSYFSNLDSPKGAIEQVLQTMENSDDDTTIVIGKIID